MAEEETNQRIAELKARLEADPGSRVFYQLGEELRKAKRIEEAEAVLRKGLETHPGYLSALISLGRVLKESSRQGDAIEVLMGALALDPQNVVVARLLAESYAEKGEHVEAIKKYKLVAALHPADEEVQQRIQELEQVLHGGEMPEEAAPPVPEDVGPVAQPESPVEPLQDEEEPAGEPATPGATEGWPQATADDEPFELHETSAEPFDQAPDAQEADEAGEIAHEEPSEAYPASDRLDDTSEEDVTPPEPPAPDVDEDSARDFGDRGEAFEPADLGGETPPPFPGNGADDQEPPLDDSSGEVSEDVVATITMGDLYARQGHIEQARSIYRRILDREPDHDEAHDRLESLSKESPGDEMGESASPSSKDKKIQRLEGWLSKVRD